MKLELLKIDIGNGTQVRLGIDQKTVGEYTEALMNGDKFPPVKVFHDGLKYYLADGYHRYFAHKNAVFKEIEVEITNGTQRDALQYALGANAKHGLKRTNEDKRNAVMIALNDIEWSMLSNREIAKLCGVSHTFVISIKEKIEKEKEPKNEKPKDLDTAEKGKFKSVETEEEDYEEDKISELLVVQKDLEEENNKLKDKIAVGSMSGTEADKKLAYETIAELRDENTRLEAELDAMTISRNSYMRENAEMKKQINYYRNKLKKLEPQE
jgi:transposase